LIALYRAKHGSKQVLCLTVPEYRKADRRRRAGQILRLDCVVHLSLARGTWKYHQYPIDSGKPTLVASLPIEFSLGDIMRLRSFWSLVAAMGIFAFGVAILPAWGQSNAVAIVGGTLIDGTGKPAVTDAVVIVQDGRFQAVGRRSEVSMPQGAEIIDAKGKSILPGLIDGHCHYRDWMGEIYLAYGVVTCPNISNNPVEWIIAQREGVKNGTVRGPRIWASANIIDGPPPEGVGTLRRQPTSIIVDSEDEAKKAVGVWLIKASTASSSSSG
jgi:hypothetical protein